MASSIDLSELTDNVVDALSNLVLAAATRDYSNTKKLIQEVLLKTALKIAERAFIQ